MAAAHTVVPMAMPTPSEPPSYPPPGASSSTASASVHRLPSGPSTGIRSYLVRLTVNLDDAELQSTGRSATPSAASGMSPPLLSSRPRWGTPEFCFYAVAFAIVFPYMWYVPIQLSQESDPHYREYSHFLVAGWMAGRKRDNSDFQYRTFRDSVPILVGLMSTYLVLSHTFEFVIRKLSAGERRGRYAPLAPTSRSDNDTSLSSSSPSRRPGRRVFLALFSSVYLLVSHGTNVWKLLACCSANYFLAKNLAGHRILTPSAIWIFNILALYFVHYFNGIPLAQYGSLFALLVCFRPFRQPGALADCEPLSGTTHWHTYPVANQLQHYDVTSCLFRARLPLGGAGAPEG